MFSLRKWMVNHFGNGQILELDGVDLWYETFGKRSDPCFLLVMGLGCQGILWPDLFCQKLSDLGFYVIRFDARDTGHSSYFDYKVTPYTLIDMAKDGVLLLDQLQIEKAHILGTSMGGAIAQIMAVHFPEKVLSVSLLATSVDFRNIVNAMELKNLDGLPLSSPSKECIEWIHSFSCNHESLSGFEKIKNQFKGWKLLNGKKAPFDKVYYGKMLVKTVWRQRSYKTILNQMFATIGSVDILLDTFGKIQFPALVIQGSEDPVFPKDHGEFLAHSLPQGQLLVVENMGHNLNSYFYDEIIGKINSCYKGV